MNTTKVYITRDEDCDQIWVWHKPLKGQWIPIDIGNEVVNYQRENKSLENTDSYLEKDFKKKFGITIRPKTRKCVHLSTELLNNEDYKLFSDNPKRKK